MYYYHRGMFTLSRSHDSVDSTRTTVYENKVVLLKLIALFGVKFVDLIT